MLTESDVVLEIGAGSGYQAAILAELAREVYSIELVPALAERARQTLARLGYRNVQVRAGDGYQGWPEHAPFSRIIITAAPEEIPQALVDQLAVGGRMILARRPGRGRSGTRHRHEVRGGHRDRPQPAGQVRADGEAAGVMT